MKGLRDRQQHMREVGERRSQIGEQLNDARNEAHADESGGAGP